MGGLKSYLYGRNSIVVYEVYNIISQLKSKGERVVVVAGSNEVFGFSNRFVFPFGSFLLRIIGDTYDRIEFTCLR